MCPPSSVRFKLYDYEVSLAIDIIEAEQIDSAVTVLPFTKLLCYDHQVGGKDRDIGLYKTLQVAPLKQLLLGESSLVKFIDGRLSNSEDRHCRDSTFGLRQRQATLRHHSQLGLRLLSISAVRCFLPEFDHAREIAGKEIPRAACVLEIDHRNGPKEYPPLFSL